MPSPNLAALHVAASQNQKEVTINDATDALDLALTATAVIDCSAGGTIPVPLAAVQRALRLVLDGSPAAGFALALPAISRALIIRNDTGVNVSVQRLAGNAGVDLPSGAESLIYCDSTQVCLITPPPAPQVYDFGMLANATPEPSAVMGKVVLPRAMILPPDFAGAQAHVDTPPAAPFVISVSRDAALVGTITIAPDGSASFATTGGQALEITPGQVIRFVAPETADAEIDGISITLAGSLIA